MISVTLINCDRLQERPFKVKGGSGIEYGTAIYNRKEGGHLVTFPLERLKEIHEDICRAAHLPLSKWRIHNVEVDHSEGETGQLLEALDKAQAEAARLAAELDNTKLDLARALDARDAALRSISADGPKSEKLGLTKEQEVALVEHAQERIAELADELSKETPAPAPEVAPAPAEPAPEAPKEEAPATPEKLTRAELEANPSFRSIRKIAKEKGVPNYTTYDGKAELIEAILAHEATAEANG